MDSWILFQSMSYNLLLLKSLLVYVYIYIPDLSCGGSFRLVLVSIIVPFFEHSCCRDVLASSTTFSALVQESDISSRSLHSFSNASNKDNKGSPESRGRCLVEKIEQDKIKQTNKQMDNGYLAETGCIWR